jgi:Ser/Thr protein kinase RdoA (MazF antagonist)
MKSVLPECHGLTQFLANHGWQEGDAVRQLGAGNRHGVFLLSSGNHRAVLKVHEPAMPGRRDAFAHEVLMHSFYAAQTGVAVPALLAHDEACRAILFDYIKGEAVSAPEEGNIEELARFLVESNASHILERARKVGLPMASESGTCTSDHWRCAVDRLDALLGSARADDVTAEMHDFLRSEVQPALDALKPSDGSAAGPCLSPSDFGFHNVIRRDDGSLCFLDFEHAGWDDPAKLVADFILQPEARLCSESAERFLEVLGESEPFGEGIRKRVRQTLAIQRCKWTMIILNVFSRRGLPLQLQAERLAKAKRYYHASLPRF